MKIRRMDVTMLQRFWQCWRAVLLAVLVAGCGAVPDPQQSDAQKTVALAAAIRDFGPDVDAEEADRAARIAFGYTRRLAREYQITDPPLIHNTKVNLGLRPRGLCWHWAKDLEARLAQEKFRTLALHRVVANSDNPFRLEHSTVIISRRGDGYAAGIVLDPWRKGGVLHWVPTRDDSAYDWQPRDAVLARKWRRKAEAKITPPRARH